MTHVLIHIQTSNSHKFHWFTWNTKELLRMSKFSKCVEMPWTDRNGLWDPVPKIIPKLKLQKSKKKTLSSDIHVLTLKQLPGNNINITIFNPFISAYSYSSSSSYPHNAVISFAFHFFFSTNWAMNGPVTFGINISDHRE